MNTHLFALLLVGAASAPALAGPPSIAFPPDDLWTRVGPVMSPEHKQNQPIVVDGNLLLGGNGRHPLFDISDPYKPVPLSVLQSNWGTGEAESHQLAVSRTADGRTRVVTISGIGVDLWDLTDPTAPVLLSEVDLEGVFYGDNTEAVWGVAWVGDTVYAGGTSTGLHVIDVSDPTDPVVVARLPTPALGGVLAGPLWAVGSLLVVTTPKEFAGIATLDLSDPRDPILLDSLVEDTKSYIGGFYGRHAHLITPLRTYDVTTDPREITLVSSVPTDDAEYVSYGDDHLFLGALRPAPGIMKWDVSDPLQPILVGKVLGRKDGPDAGVFTDDQFSTPIGNLLVLCDDEITYGCQFGVHDTRIDTTAPRVLWSSPLDGATGVSPEQALGVSFSDAIETASLTPDTWILRAVEGGAEVPGDWSIQGTVVGFQPHQPLATDTTYELVLPRGGVSDLVGNTLTEAVSITFATGAELLRLPCDPGPPAFADVGAPIALSAGGTLPDGAAVSWGLPDGSTLAGAQASVQFASPGRWPVTLSVSVGDAVRTCATTVVVAPSAADRSPTTSGALVHDAARGVVWSLHPDADALVAVSTDTRAPVRTIRTGDDPQAVALTPDGTLWVSARAGDEVTAFDGDSGTILASIPLRYGCGPHGLAPTPDGREVVVACGGSGELVVLDAASHTVRDTIALYDDPLAPRPPLRHVGVVDTASGWTAFAPQFTGPDATGWIHRVNGPTLQRLDPVALAADPGPDTNFSGRGVPNTLHAAVPSPDGGLLLIPGAKPNVFRGLATDGEPLDPDNTIRTLIAGVSTDDGTEALRLDLDDHEGTIAATFSPVGDLVFLVSRGSNRVDVHDRWSGQKVGGFGTGLAPTAITLDGSGRAWVLDSLDRTLTVVDVAGMLDATDAAAPRVATVAVLEDEPLAPEILLGKRLFHNASARDLSQDGYISCASCHPDGGHDGRTWDFTDRGEGMRNTTDLRGRAGTAHGPVHWSGNFDEIQDFEHDIRNAFGGAGLMDDADFADGVDEPLGTPKAGLSPRLDALAAYVATFDTYPRSPHRLADGGWTPEALRGRALFDRFGCADCHAGDILTDSPSGTRHDVGTITPQSGQRLGGPLDGLDTPTLHGLHATAPYLHDGSAPTVQAVMANPDHTGKALNAPQVRQLTAFLMQLDGGALPNPTGCGGCGAGTAGGGAGSVWLLLPLGGLLRRRRDLPRFVGPRPRAKDSEDLVRVPLRVGEDLSGQCRRHTQQAGERLPG